MMPSSPPTEGRNPRTIQLDTVPTAERVRMILREDAVAIDSALAAVTDITQLVDATVSRLERGGRIRYAGAGASGRLAVLDATEATPTFGVDPGLIQGCFPGGPAALADSSIDFEDALEHGRADLAGIAECDVVIGVTASGGTAYVRGALDAARAAGALTGLITSNPSSPLAALADITVVADTGPEALTGSTRLKAGTATKVILNAFSTAVLVGRGHTWSNLMVGLVASNEKLRERSVRLLVEASGLPAENCRAVLADSSGRLPLALVRLLSGSTPAAAERALEQHGNLREALAQLAEEAP